MANAISIIIPVHNDEKYILETLESIMTQTFQDYEVIVVDDGSNDSTCDLVQSVCDEDDRFSLIKQKHANAGVARNAGYEVSTGEYVLFFDGDDLMKPDMLSIMLDNAEQYDSDITVCQAESFSEENKSLEKSCWAAIGKDEWGPFGAEFNVVYKGVDLPYSPFFTTMGWAWDKLFRRSFIEKHNLRFQSISSTNDARFVFCAIALSERIVFIEDALVCYRKHAASISATRSKSPHNALKAFESIEDELQKYPEIWTKCAQSCINWGISHLRWNYRTLEGNPRQEAFEDYKKLLLSVLKEWNSDFHDCEENWVRDAFLKNANNESMYIADTAIDYGYIQREKENLIKNYDSAVLELNRVRDELNTVLLELNRVRDELNTVLSHIDALENSVSFKIGRALTYIPRKIRGSRN